MATDISKASGGFLKVTASPSDPILLSPSNLSAGFVSNDLVIKNRDTNRVFYSIPFGQLTIGGVAYSPDKDAANTALEAVFPNGGTAGGGGGAPASIIPATIVASGTLSSASVFFLDATADAITVELPAAVSKVNGFIYLKRIDGTDNLLTVTSADEVDGDDSFTIDTKNQVIVLFSDGTTWYILN